MCCRLCVVCCALFGIRCRLLLRVACGLLLVVVDGVVISCLFVVAFPPSLSYCCVLLRVFSFLCVCGLLPVVFIASFIVVCGLSVAFAAVVCFALLRVFFLVVR